MTKLGLGSYGVGWSVGVTGYAPPANPMTPLGLLEFAESLGLKLVQYADNLPLDVLDHRARKALCERASQSGISIEVGTRGIATEHLRNYIDIARYFGSPILRVVVDTATSHPEPAEVIDLVGAILPDLRSAGITLAIENHDRFKARVLASIVRTLNDPHVGICLDTVNSFGALEGPDVVVAALGPFVVNLHLKEFVVRRAPHNMGFEVTGAPAGKGMLDVPWLLDALRTYGRVFNAIIETWLPPQATTQATIDVERDWVSQSVAYLRTVITD